MKGPGWKGAYGYVEFSEFERFHLFHFHQIIPMARTNERTNERVLNNQHVEQKIMKLYGCFPKWWYPKMDGL